LREIVKELTEEVGWLPHEIELDVVILLEKKHDTRTRGPPPPHQMLACADRLMQEIEERDMETLKENVGEEESCQRNH
jgi:hypothetical protein